MNAWFVPSCQQYVPQLGLAWLAEYSFNARCKKRIHQDKNSQLRHIEKEETTPDEEHTTYIGDPG
jgi:hypothetical protein